MEEQEDCRGDKDEEGEEDSLGSKSDEEEKDLQGNVDEDDDEEEKVESEQEPKHEADAKQSQEEEPRLEVTEASTAVESLQKKALASLLVQSSKLVRDGDDLPDLSGPVDRAAAMAASKESSRNLAGAHFVGPGS